MFRRLLLVLASIIWILSTTSADPVPKATPKAEPSTDPNLMEARFVDASVVQMTMLETDFTITLKYGKLTIPFADVKRVEFGFRYPEGVEEKVRSAISDLASTDFRERETAQKKLVEQGEFSLPALRAILKNSSNAEQVRRAEETMKLLEVKLPKEKLSLPEFDVIVTQDATFRGKIDMVGFKAKNRFFGESTIKVADLRELRPLRGQKDAFVLDAAKYGRQGLTEWMDTAIDVSTDESLEVSVDGQVDQWPQEPGKYMSGPAGTGAYYYGQPFGGGGGGGIGIPGGRMMSGAVYAKIGEKGTPFLVGASYKQSKAPATGRLYLIVAPSSWGNDSSGEYKVKAKVGN